MSKNFDFFRNVDECAKYAAIGAYAEYYYHNDIRSAYVKLGLISEGLVNGIIKKVGGPGDLETYSIKINWLEQNNHITPVTKEMLNYVNAARIYGAHDIINPKFEASEEKFTVFSSALKAYGILYRTFYLQPGRRFREREFALPDVIHGEDAYLSTEAELREALEREERNINALSEKQRIIEVQNETIEHAGSVISEKAEIIRSLEDENERFRERELQNSEVSLTDIERRRLNEFRREEYMKASPVNELETVIDVKGLPVCVWKENWTTDYYFKVTGVRYDEEDRLIGIGNTYNNDGPVKQNVQYYGSVKFHIYCDGSNADGSGAAYGEIDTAVNLYNRYGRIDGEPVVMQKTGWFGDFCFVAEKADGQNLTGKTYRNGEVYHPEYTMEYSEMCQVYSGMYLDIIKRKLHAVPGDDAELADLGDLSPLELE